MALNYDPTVTQMRQAYEDVYGEQGIYLLIGIMYANLKQPAIERIYHQILESKELRKELI